MSGVLKFSGDWRYIVHVINSNQGHAIYFCDINSLLEYYAWISFVNMYKQKPRIWDQRKRTHTDNRCNTSMTSVRDCVCMTSHSGVWRSAPLFICICCQGNYFFSTTQVMHWCLWPFSRIRIILIQTNSLYWGVTWVIQTLNFFTPEPNKFLCPACTQGCQLLRIVWRENQKWVFCTRQIVQFWL